MFFGTARHKALMSLSRWEKGRREEGFLAVIITLFPGRRGMGPLCPSGRERAEDGTVGDEPSLRISNLRGNEQ